MVENSGELIHETKTELRMFQNTEAKCKRDITTARSWRQHKTNNDLIKVSDKYDPNDILGILQHLVKMDEDSFKQQKRSLIDLVIRLDVDDFSQDGAAILEHPETNNNGTEAVSKVSESQERRTIGRSSSLTMQKTGRQN